MNYCNARKLFVAALVMGALSCSGCGGQFTTVNGKVTLDGKPIEKGNISFMPADGHGSSAAETIKDGQYTAQVKPGKYKVQINGFRKVGERHVSEGDPASPIVDVSEQIVPERYNAKTELTCEITGGQQELGFPLGKQ